MERITIPNAAELIISRLEEHGFEAYVVGGCVRDSIMGITPHDWDICTSALPEQIIEIFNDLRVVPTGLKHGTVTVVIEDCEYEVTTFRTDGEYKDNRHPEKVEFVRCLKLDLMRRDFTINALAYNHRTGIIDYFNGLEDIENKVIRCVGNPNDRLSEDALRIMRSIRFAIRFGFEVDQETKAALMFHKKSLENISIERINSEVEKIMRCDNLHGKEDLLFTFITLLSVVVPEFNSIDMFAVSNRLANSTGLYEVRLALLFDFDKKELECVLKRLRFPNDVIKIVTTINQYGRNIRDDHNWRSAIDTTLASSEYNKSDYYERKLIHDISYEPAIFSVEYAKSFVPENSFDRTMLKILDLRLCSAFLEEVCRLSDLEINGNDLIILGYRGKEIGNTLNAILDMVMRHAIPNDYDLLVQIAKSIKEYLI